MKFHLRRLDREIKDKEILKRLLTHTQHFILSMTDGDEPYAVPLGYVYIESKNTIYFHCAKVGKKLELLKRNPKIWGLVILDLGIIDGACVNLYASAMFSGKVEWIKEKSEKIEVMNLFALKLNRDVEGVKTRLQKIFDGEEAALTSVIFGKIKIEELSGKCSTEMTLEKLLKFLS